MKPNVTRPSSEPSLTIPEVVASVAPRDPALSNHMLNEVRVGSFYFPMLLRPSPFHA
jgi:hypothetical protein